MTQRHPNLVNRKELVTKQMTPEFITGFFFDAIKTAISLAAPMLLAGLGVGLLVSIFQAATSINEMTMVVFTQDLFENLMFYVR